MSSLDSFDKQSKIKNLSVGDWVIILLILAIPIVNLVMLFVWAFGDSDPIRSNFAKANLIWMAIVFALALLFFGIFGTAIFYGMQQGL